MTELEKTIKVKDCALANGTSSTTAKVRRQRTAYSRSHLELLLKTFETNPYPGILVREKLAQLIGVHESRIQVWFQNRRARKNRKITTEEENRLHDTAWPQFTQISQEGQVAQPERNMEYTEKSEEIYKTCALPLQTRSHLHMNNLAGPQPFSYVWPNHCQPTGVVAPSCFRNSSDITQPQLQPMPDMKPQLFSSSNLPHATSPLETHSPDYTSACASASQPGMSADQKFSLQDILEEFQPCWTEAAINSIGINDDLLF